LNYYNEIDPKAAAWLRALIDEGLIPKGEIDTRSIRDVQPRDVRGFTQCHFFAGIGGWPYAMQLAKWPVEWNVWTGSCPCQPYSIGNLTNGGAQGPSDRRDLWSDFYRLIGERKPPIVFGEQVESAIAWGWLDRAAMDLEAKDYALGAAVLPANALGADHQRKRLFWMAYSKRERRKGSSQIERISCSAAEEQPINGDSLTRARCVLAGDLSGLLPCNGISVQLERDALKGYGNAIVPQVASEFVQASIEAIESIDTIVTNP
jgi:DNA (cytosine-5)-methyltransferase 1